MAMKRTLETGNGGLEDQSNRPSNKQQRLIEVDSSSRPSEQGNVREYVNATPMQPPATLPGVPKSVYKSSNRNEEHSSDEDFQENRRSKNVPRQYSRDLKKQSLDLVSFEQVVKTFNLKLKKPHNLITKYKQIVESMNKLDCFEKMKQLEVEEVLQMLIVFLSDSPPSVKEVLDESLVYANSFIALYKELEGFKCPPDYDGSNETHSQMKLMSYYSQAVKKLLNSNTLPKKNTIEHDTVKMFYKEFFTQMTRQPVRHYGVCVEEIMLERLQSEKKPTRSRTNLEKRVFEAVTVMPDAVIGFGFESISIPLEVYCPHLYKDELRCVEDNLSLSESENEFVSREVFFDNFPYFRGPKRSLGSFKRKMAIQLLLQILATSKDYLHNRIEKILAGQEITFIGLFAYQLDIYLMKVVGTDSRFLGKSNEGDNSQIFIQYFPLPLDLNEPNHAIALSVFLEYHRKIHNIE